MCHGLGSPSLTLPLAWLGCLPASLPSPAACNYAQGRWVYDKNRRPAYSGLSCKAIRSSYNCMRNGRRDTAFFHYRWQPSGCNMPDFNPKTFLSLVKNKVSTAQQWDPAQRHALQALAAQAARCHCRPCPGMRSLQGRASRGLW